MGIHAASLVVFGFELLHSIGAMLIFLGQGIGLGVESNGFLFERREFAGQHE